MRFPNSNLLRKPEMWRRNPGSIPSRLKPGGLGAPAAELHDLPVGNLRPPHPLLRLHHLGREPRRRGELGSSLGVGLIDVGIGVLVKGPEGIVPAAEALVLERLHRRYAGRHDPRFRCRWPAHIFASDVEISISKERRERRRRWVWWWGVNLEESSVLYGGGREVWRKERREKRGHGQKQEAEDSGVRW